MADLALRAIDVDLERNTLRLHLIDDAPDDEDSTEAVEATIDIGTSGRLIGVELDDRYIDVMPAEPGTEHLIRSAEAMVAVTRAADAGDIAWIDIPRLGSGYEITWPSGNQ